MSQIRLGINVDHVATLRNARGGSHPDPVVAAKIAVAAGADSITMHLREDRRHIRDSDLARMRETVAAPINLEMAATEEMLRIACQARPHACCLVPERRQELTTEGGLDAAGQEASLRAAVARLAAAGIAVSLFVDPDPRQLAAAARLGAAAVELHTGSYAEGREGELPRLAAAARLSTQLGIACHAGHGLTYGNVGPVAAIPEVVELNIGHFLIGQAIFDGLAAVVAQMKRLMEESRA
jgi:pyridoxine 5-phosphate synthase